MPSRTLDSLWSLILPVTVNAFNLVIMRNFFQGIPDSLEEAARIGRRRRSGCVPAVNYAAAVSMASIARAIGLFTR